MYAPSSQHQNIFELSTAIVKGTQCSVNVTLCALMRVVYLKYPGKAAGDAKKIVRAFRHTLDKDQEKHGKKFDDLLDIDAIDAATSAQDEPDDV
ncbi:hypothetical protein B0H14DRAFT_3429738 [Mycena olivaceomarginata]|nr:hypothetical protein B0H14DRAFT_3429738 [Mycena olivaceomarginata]